MAEKPTPFDVIAYRKLVEEAAATIREKAPFEVRTGRPVTLEVTPFALDDFADLASTARAEDGRMLFSPSGYLWLNRELARLTEATARRLGGLERLPSRRLRRRAPRHGLHRAPSFDRKEGTTHGKRPS